MDFSLLWTATFFTKTHIYDCSWPPITSIKSFYYCSNCCGISIGIWSRFMVHVCSVPRRNGILIAGGQSDKYNDTDLSPIFLRTEVQRNNYVADCSFMSQRSGMDRLAMHVWTHIDWCTHHKQNLAYVSTLDLRTVSLSDPSLELKTLQSNLVRARWQLSCCCVVGAEPAPTASCCKSWCVSRIWMLTTSGDFFCCREILVGRSRNIFRSIFEGY